MNNIAAVLLVVAAFLVIIPASWLAIIYGMARLSGWLELARLYPGPDRIAGEVHRFASARFRMFVGYNRNLTITLSPEGLHIRPMILFRLRHAPLLIPWTAVTELERKGLALFPMIDVLIDPGASGRPFKTTFYGRHLVTAIERYAAGNAHV